MPADAVLADTVLADRVPADAVRADAVLADRVLADADNGRNGAASSAAMAIRGTRPARRRLTRALTHR